jgi:hypothetical protein
MTPESASKNGIPTILFEGRDAVGAAASQGLAACARVELSDEEFLARMKSRPFVAPGTVREGRPHCVPSDVAIPVDAAADALRGLVVTPDEGSPPSRENVWRAFNAFAEVRVQAVDGDVVTDDALLFRWGPLGRDQFEWDPVRQFTVDEPNGAYKQMLQLHGGVVFPRSGLRELRGGDVGGDPGTVGDWVKRVECLEAFQLPVARTPNGFEVFLEAI